jgi:hypothetical protein
MQKGEFNSFLAHVLFTLAYAISGNISKARFYAAKLLKMNPNFSVEDYRMTTFFKNPKHLEPLIDALRKAGIPDTPPKSDSK